MAKSNNLNHNAIPEHLASRFEPAYIAYWNKHNVGRLSTHQVPIEDYRADPAKYTIAYGREVIPQGNLKVTDQKCPVEGGEITVRVIEPDPTRYPATLRPVYVNFHGGGWVFGGLQTDFDFCKRLAHEVGVVCFDVDYRLAPEYKFPIPLNDCWAAFNWIRDHKAKEFNLDLTRLTIGGCSAGGHLTAVIALMCRDLSIPLAFQLLGVPVCDMHVFTPTSELRPDQPYESYRDMEFTQPLPVERMRYFHEKFFGNPRSEQWNGEDKWKVSPMLASSLEGLASALVITAEMDPLRDEGEEYAKRLKAAGVPTEVHRIKGAPHIVMQLDGILEGGKEFNRIVVDTLRKFLRE